MRRISFIVVTTLAIGILPAKAQASPLDPVVARASFGMQVVGYFNGVRFVAYGGRARSDVFGDGEWLCVEGDRTVINNRVSPAVRTTTFEEACAWGPSLPMVKYGVDLGNWETSMAAGIRTQVREELSRWNSRYKRWEGGPVRTFPSITYVTLRWKAKMPGVEPVLHAPVCMIFFVVPVPCPQPAGAGLERTATVTGAMSFRALGTRVTLPSAGVTYAWTPSHAIWWDS